MGKCLASRELRCHPDFTKSGGERKILIHCTAEGLGDSKREEEVNAEENTRFGGEERVTGMSQGTARII